MSFRLGIVKSVIACMFVSHVAVTSVAVLQVVRKSGEEGEKIAFTALTGLHLAVLFSSFTYYWRLYSASAKLEFQLRSILRINQN